MVVRRVLAVALIPVAILLLALVGSRTAGDDSDSAAEAHVGSADWARNLLDELPVDDDSAPETSPYERDDEYRWIDQDGDCQDLPHEVMIAENLDPVTFADERQCTVAAGRWLDPYTGDEMLTARKPRSTITPGTCDDRYPGVCIPLSDDDLDCADIIARSFPVAGTDPHCFDGDGNGVGCESSTVIWSSRLRAAPRRVRHRHAGRTLTDAVRAAHSDQPWQ